jgi:uncharacterized protein YcbK (DUF882 family)
MAKYFKKEEFRCHDGTPVPLIYLPNLIKLMNKLDVIREEIGLPIRIMSGYRTKKYNMGCGGKPQSAHLFALAADIQCDLDPKVLYSVIQSLIDQKKISDGGLSLYPTWVHVDCARPRRW